MRLCNHFLKAVSLAEAEIGLATSPVFVCVPYSISKASCSRSPSIGVLQSFTAATNIFAPENSNGWKMEISWNGGFGLFFRGELLVSGRVYDPLHDDKASNWFQLWIKINVTAQFDAVDAS